MKRELTEDEIAFALKRKVDDEPTPTDNEDLAYERAQGQEQSWNQGSMLGSPNV